jgi:NAD+ synthase
MMKTNQIIDHIVEWLNTYCDKSGLNGFVVGVSGGVDSAVTSTLCAKTGKEVFVLNMPIYQAPDQESLSARHIAWLEKKYSRVRGIKIDLTTAFTAVEDALPSDIQDGLTMANTRSRLRMMTLYAVASHHRMLVAGTGNKVEDFGVGFYTKYGDGGVDLSPIADLSKTQVYSLARELGVIEPILMAPPTDGLWADNRTDESQIGASYAELEWAMAFEEKTLTEDPVSERQKEVLAIYRKFNTANRHKMLPIPVCRIPGVLKGGTI